MPEGGQPGFTWTANSGTFGVPALALSMWNPLLTGAIRWDAQLDEGVGTIVSEWQKFVSGRVRENLAFMQRVAHSRTLDQVWATYGEFWHKAVEDYGKEYMIMSRFVTGVTSKSVAALQSATHQASTDGVRASRIG